MEKKLNKKNYIIFGIVIIFIVIYCVYRIINLVANPTDTFVVEKGKLSFEETKQGYVIRDETVVKGENYKNGMNQIKTEGEKVAKGEAIFRYYTSGEEKLKQKIQELDVKIQEAWENENNLFSSDIKSIETQIEAKLKESYGINDLQKVKEYKKDINSYITKKAKIAGEKSPSGSYLKKLIEERSKYENELNSGSEYIKAPKSGVVSYRVDGLEETLTPNNFGALSKKMLEDLNLKTGQIVSTNEESGKIIDNFYCYIATIIDEDTLQKENTEVGSKIKIRLSNEKEVEAQIAYISKENEKEDLVILKIERYVEELINYRKISFDIIWWNVTGLKVSNEAIHYEENNQELAYIIRKRVGYTDKIYVKVLKQSDKYSIIENYDDSSELTEKGVSKDEIENRKKIAMYDEVQL